jgi:hypothetical protein
MTLTMAAAVATPVPSRALPERRLGDADLGVLPSVGDQSSAGGAVPRGTMLTEARTVQPREREHDEGDRQSQISTNSRRRR